MTTKTVTKRTAAKETDNCLIVAGKRIELTPDMLAQILAPKTVSKASLPTTPREKVETAKDLAKQINSERAELQATLDAQNGKASFLGLYDAKTKQRVNAKLLRGKFGPYWMIFNANHEQVMVPSKKDPSQKVPYCLNSGTLKSQEPCKALREAGFFEKMELVPAEVVEIASRRGNSGRVFVKVERTDHGYPGAKPYERPAK